MSKASFAGDFHCRWMLSAGTASGAQDVGHLGVVTGRDGFSLRSIVTIRIFGLVGLRLLVPSKTFCYSRWSHHLPLQSP